MSADDADPVDDRGDLLEPYRYEPVQVADDPRSFGPARSYARENPEQFAPLRRALQRARYGQRYDTYVARSTRLCGGAGLVGFALGVVLAAGVLLTGLSLATLVVALVLPPGVTLLLAALTAGARYVVPRVRALRRGRQVRIGLPHATVFLFALTHGGVSLYEAIDRLAETDQTHGPIADEFDQVATDTTLFDRDLYESLTAARERAPHEKFGAFVNELVSVLETGGDVGTFLRNEAESNVEAVRERQNELVDDLDTLTEVYIVFVFSGPIFLLVVLLVVSFVADALVAMQVLVYLLVPLAIVGFAGVFWWLLEPFGELAAVGPTLGWRQWRSNPPWARFRTGGIAACRRQPTLILWLSVPAAVAIAVAAWLVVPPGQPIQGITGTIAIPLLIAGSPFALLQRRERRRQREIRRRFPDALDVIAEAVDNGVPVTEAFALVADRTGGELADELARVQRDVSWTGELTDALSRFAQRVDVPQITRTTHLLSESARATDDLGPVFRLVGEDLDRRNAVRRERDRRMQPYVVIIFLGVVVYLAIIAMFDAHFLPVVAERAAEADSVQRTAFQIDPAPTSTYRELFFHSALIQAVGNGLVLGKLTDDRLRSGVGYACVLIVLIVVTFLVLGSGLY